MRAAMLLFLYTCFHLHITNMYTTESTELTINDVEFSNIRLHRPDPAEDASSSLTFSVPITSDNAGYIQSKVQSSEFCAEAGIKDLSLLYSNRVFKGVFGVDATFVTQHVGDKEPANVGESLTTIPDLHSTRLRGMLDVKVSIATTHMNDGTVNVIGVITGASSTGRHTRYVRSDALQDQTVNGTDHRVTASGAVNLRVAE